MMLRLIPLVCVVALSVAQDCGTSRFASRTSDQLIVGGVEARAGEWPWQISLRNRDYHICGGSIIDARTVITAAHCVGGGAKNYQVLAGEHDRTENEGNEQLIQVRSIKKHRKYSSRTMANDIAILFLETPLQFNDYVSPVCLPRVSDGEFVGDLATVTGWGATENTGDNSVLREVSVPVLSNTDCNQKYPGMIDDTMICAGLEKGGKDSCQGDSGGPMVNNVNGKWHLIGVVSWGYGCADAGNPGVYSRVTALRSWVDGQRSRYAKSQLSKIGGNGDNNGNAFGKDKNVGKGEGN